ncbi:hypothetical protein ACFQ3L_10630 [Lacticaseibacillus jixianensis]|uniref:Uncharacterized protein n=1 Tax=Lacticaseibacillus jixianensis TaxID=2486012 RepID=A0ABW4BCU5_9LACO|nr:hypothetical protein [Lacticaseibacillus jixianensis]
MEEKQLRALIADAADTLAAEQFTETQVEARATAWQKAAPAASLAEQTVFMLAENRAYTEELLAAVLTKVLGEGRH